ncbi:hypothetical protein LR48_Vigan08g004300 [Vigna angularis]|uniref:Uncharacterized protein n=1 Tax=Phaseolus angularis TaxID=3914 RepID=A0A0L9V2N2_PHAAN|nr:hypothetical protein LR48_Vigan747s002000 [Vigna angularis]KOM49216.1 hypothetical protein LR48_Vigan08g004300 [Vigna angularis]
MAGKKHEDADYVPLPSTVDDVMSMVNNEFVQMLLHMDNEVIEKMVAMFSEKAPTDDKVDTTAQPTLCDDATNNFQILPVKKLLKLLKKPNMADEEIAISCTRNPRSEIDVLG